ncbi:MAG: mercury transporter MerT [Hyphomicrobiaceae bacterium]|nr:MAG: mercury transporter MerT [Hyphomicrobiaceae bacterium]
MAQTTEIETAENASQQLMEDRTRARLIAAGGLLGGLAATSCCILPLVLFSVGISGAWIANLTALAPYKPYFAVGTLALLGYGSYLVYLRPKQACADGSCARALPDRLTRASLWIATVLVAAALAFDYVAPLLLS